MLSVVIPVRDESENIERLIVEVHEALGDTDFEVVCVDDGSEDDTASVLEALTRRYRRFRWIQHERGLGQSAAVRTGVQAARGRWIVTMDGDGQNDPADIPRLVAELASAGGAMAIGWRRERQDPWLKRVSSKVANMAYRFVLGDPTPDVGCGLKLFERAAFLELPYFDHMHRFLPALVRSRGGRVRSVVVHHRSRRNGASKYGVIDRLRAGIVDILGVRWLLSRQTAPPMAQAEPTEAKELCAVSGVDAASLELQFVQDGVPNINEL